MYLFCLPLVQCLTQLLNTGPRVGGEGCQQNTPNSAITHPVSHRTTGPHWKYFPANGLAMSQILLIFSNTTSAQKLWCRYKNMLFIEFFNL